MNIRITDPRGELVTLSEISTPQDNVEFLNGGKEIEAVYGKGVACTEPPIDYAELVFDAPVNKIGTYTVHKVLTILTDPIDAMLVDTIPGVVSFAQFRDSLLHQYLDSTACDFGCERYVMRYMKDSLAALETPEVLDTAGNIAHREKYHELYDSWCNMVNVFASDTTSLAFQTCESIYERMLTDVSPGGRYFTIDFFFEKDNVLRVEEWTGFTTMVQIEDNWTDSSALELVEGHPEYCHYETCIKDSVDARLKVKMSLVFRWSDAVARGYTVPSFYADYDNYKWPSRDPMSGEPTLYSLYDDKFNNFYEIILDRNVEDNPYADLLQFTDWTLEFAETYMPVTETTILQHFNPQDLLYADVDFTGFVPDAGPDYGLPANILARLDTLRWFHFRDLLFAVKEKGKADHIAPGCRFLPEDSAIVQHPDPHRDGIPTDTEADNIVREVCQNTCESFASRYYPRIMAYCEDGALSLPQDSITLKRLLNKYCNETCGIDNPLGLLKFDDINKSVSDSIRLFMLENGFSCYWDSITTANIPIKYYYAIDTATGDTITGTICTPDGIEALLIFLKAKKLNGVYSGDTAGLAMAVQILEQWNVDTGRIIAKDDHFTFYKGENEHCGAPPCVSTFYLLDSTGNKIHNIEDIIFYRRLYKSPLGASALYQYYANQITPYYAQYQVVVINDEGGTLKYRTGYLYMLNYNYQGSGCGLDFKGDCIAKPILIWGIDTSVVKFPGADSCLRDLTQSAINLLQDRYLKYLDSIKLSLYEAYIDSCFKFREKFVMKYKLNDYHYTLYYYDQAGNLVQTVPPEGVYPLQPSDFNTSGARIGTPLPEPEHVLKTQYRYNTRNQPIWQNTPDADSTRFFYNYKGQLILSQNAKQKPLDKYSFTLYDHIGRIMCVGEIDRAAADDFVIEDALENTRFPLDEIYMPSASLSQLTLTFYDKITEADLGEFTQSNLRNRVSATYTADAFDTDFLLQVLPADNTDILFEDDITSHLDGDITLTAYTYDEVGNVKSMVQQLNNQELEPTPDLLAKQIDYDYDLISGKVNKVTFQPDKSDQFIHKYEYDADNRITDVYTSRDGIIDTREAKYFYYPHGPLARIEIGQDKVQGMDYAYTLQGWLKGINHNIIDAGDLSLDANYTVIDGPNDTLNKYTPFDQLKMALMYYRNDYASVGYGAINPADLDDVVPFYHGQPSNKYKGLYNGNIMGIGVGIMPFLTAGDNPWNIEQYRYDQLNRIVESKGVVPSLSTPGTYDPTVRTSYTYDKNGNIKTLNRTAWNESATAFQLMDSMLYQYTYSSGKLLHNKLGSVDDRQTDHSRFAEDIDDQSSGNYDYDEIGNLVKDDKEHIEEIEWNVYGKIKRIIFNNGKPGMEFRYDATGNRIAKLLVNADMTASTDTIYTATYYWRDAQGNILSTESRRHYPLPVMEPSVAETVTHGTEVEYNIYGSSRIGTFRDTIRYDVPTSNPYGEFADFRTRREYELSNHLGNVLATVNDVKTSDPEEDDGPLDGLYKANAISANDYYAFGMLMPGRTFANSSIPSLGKYRFGFNGQEKDDEVSGKGNMNSAMFWEYDTRLGKRWNPDPKPIVGISVYSTFLNNPVIFPDPNGDEVPTKFYDKDGNQTNTIPDVVQKEFNDRGIVLAYNKETQMMYQSGTCVPTKPVSALENERWQTELAQGCTSDGSLVFGYNFGISVYVNNTFVGQGKIAQAETDMATRTSYIDLGDYDADGMPLGFEKDNSGLFSGEISLSTYSLMKLLDHDFLGHAISLLRDDYESGQENIWFHPGPVEDQIVNPIREQLNEPLRLNYNLNLNNINSVDFGKTIKTFYPSINKTFEDLDYVNSQRFYANEAFLKITNYYINVQTQIPK